MGMIRVMTYGSFGVREFEVSAQKHGHAQAAAEAIHWLAEHVLPDAIRRDHELHAAGQAPEDGKFQPFNDFERAR